VNIAPAGHPRPSCLILLILLSPLAIYLGLTAFAYPATDDWCGLSSVQSMGALGTLVDYLRHWGGRYTSSLINVVVLAMPLPLTTYAVVIALHLLVTMLAWRVFLPASLPSPWWWAAGCTGLLAATFPSSAAGLYWLSGMTTYVLPFSLTALGIGILRRWPDRRWSPASAITLGILTAGCGETPAVLAGITACCLWLLGDRPARWLFWGLCFGLALSLAAPGSWGRLQVVTDTTHGPPMPLLEAGKGALGLTVRMMTDLVWGPLPCTLLCTARLGWEHGGRASWRLPAAAVVAMVAGGTLGLAPILAAVGVAEGRHFDAVWCLLLAWALALAWWAGCWWRERITSSARLPDKFAPFVLAILGAWCLVAAFGASPPQLGEAAPWAWSAGYLALAIALIAGLRTRMASTWSCAACAVLALWLSWEVQVATLDLVVRAPQRRAEQWLRDQQVAALAATGVRHLRVPFPDPAVCPTTISVGDLAAGGGIWWNQAYARFHGVDWVTADPRCVVVEPVEPPVIRR
jgi:hypothetical protein